jgi:phage FluMu protein Com
MLMNLSASDDNPRCWRCEKYLAVKLTRPWKTICPRCKAMNKSEPISDKEEGDAD